MNRDRVRKAEKLFHAALEQAPEARQAFLDEACGEDRELRRQLELLISKDERAGSLFERPQPPDSTLPLAAELLVGRQFGPYRIVAPLGKGGMGVVYRALDTRLNRPVAIKFLANDLADADARRRFQLEAQMASSLNHPHIVTVHDVGELEGRQYLVTEYVDGGTLKDWLRGRSRNWRDAVELLAGVADGLAAAHEAGILHRDIKPHNVLVTKSGYAKLADFGLAKLEDRIAPEDETRTLQEGITRPGVILGTVAYMSPEQAAGRRVDARSDVFSFGVLLYEALNGKHPFTGGSDVEVVHSILHGAPELPCGDVPPAVRTVIEKALEKDPAGRYQSMREMVVEFRRLLRQANSARGASPTLWKYVAAAMMTAVIAAAAWKFWPAAEGRPIRRIAVLPLENISGDPGQEAFADGTTEAIILDLAQVHSLSVISHTSVMHYKGTKKTIPEIAREVHADAFVAGTVQHAGGRVRVNAQLIIAASDRNMWGGRFDREGSDILRLEEDVAQAIAQEVRAQITPEETRRLTRARKVDPAAYDEYLMGRYLAWENKGPEPYRQAIQHLERAIQIDSNFAAAHAELASAWALRFANGFAEFREAEGPARTAVARAQSLDAELAETHAATAHVAATFDWDWVTGERELRRSLELDPNSLDMCGCMAITLLVMGRPKEALRWLDHAMQINPLSSEMEALYSWALVYDHRPQDALEHLRRARELDSQNLDVYLSLSWALEETGKPEEAVQSIVALGPSGSLARAYVHTGRRSEARKLIRQLKDPADLAIAYASLGDADRALEAVSAAIDRREFNAVLFRADPAFDSLRSNPRFQQQMARLKIPDSPR